MAASDEKRLDEINAWMGLSCKDVDELHEKLKNGQALCELILVLQPESNLQIRDVKKPFDCMVNIGNYCGIASSYGVPEHQGFEIDDLWEKENMEKVMDNLIALKTVAERKGNLLTERPWMT